MRTHAVPMPASTNGSTTSATAIERDARPSAPRGCFFAVEELLHGGPYARSLTRSPSSPDGRKMSTAISTRNANTSW